MAGWRLEGCVLNGSLIKIPNSPKPRICGMDISRARSTQKSYQNTKWFCRRKFAVLCLHRGLFRVMLANFPSLHVKITLNMLLSWATEHEVECSVAPPDAIAIWRARQSAPSVKYLQWWLLLAPLGGESGIWLPSWEICIILKFDLDWHRLLVFCPDRTSGLRFVQSAGKIHKQCSHVSDNFKGIGEYLQFTLLFIDLGVSMLS